MKASEVLGLIRGAVMTDKSVKKKAEIIPVQMTEDSTFKFRCHKDVSCFTRCCRGIDIMLTPYDVIRMKKCLGMTSDDFLPMYTELRLLEKTDLPMPVMRLLDDEKKSCPFVRDSGCLIYEDRPTACRYYPLGVASLAQKPQDDESGFYFLLQEDICKGHEESTEWTVKKWREDQGVDLHDSINAGWTDIVVRKKSFPQDHKLSEASKQMYFMACYNLDSFRTFVFESTFLKRYNPFDPKLLERIKVDDIALLDFSTKWVTSTFFKRENPDPMFRPLAPQAG